MRMRLMIRQEAYTECRREERGGEGGKGGRVGEASKGAP